MPISTIISIETILLPFILPIFVGITFLIAGKRFIPTSYHSSILGIATLSSIATGHFLLLGLPDLFSPRAEDFLFWGPFIAGLLGLFMERAKNLRRQIATPLFIGLVFGLSALLIWQILKRQHALWQTDLLPPLIHQAWGLDALVGTLLLWLGIDKCGSQLEKQPLHGAPILLTPLAFTLGGAGVCTILSGSLRIGSHLGNCAISLGCLSLLSWRYPHMKPSHSSLSVATCLLALSLIYTQAFIDLPRSIAGVILLAPLSVYLGLQQRKTLHAALIGGTCCIIWVLMSIGLVAAYEHGEQNKDSSSETTEDEVYYPY